MQSTNKVKRTRTDTMGVSEKVHRARSKSSSRRKRVGLRAPDEGVASTDTGGPKTGHYATGEARAKAVCGQRRGRLCNLPRPPRSSLQHIWSCLGYNGGDATSFTIEDRSPCPNLGTVDFTSMSEGFYVDGRSDC